ncbi:hypothetical protein GALMADRAFT_257155 [Galerina marginata CBS 339.88]|uniref:Heterokaryon incompatibility domain-containing protein n=1 Tax=Galerina marginata (strain CBS 339.88) TaxID=685588 RepID=A0A067SNW3_GALM3|nr:hypothetical protein GALMADRAFT_257155 [Galerina marginata CBS 339.88]
MSKVDPRRTQSICSYCWENLFGPHGWLESALSDHQFPANHTYKRSFQASSKSGCRWCEYVVKHLHRHSLESVPITVALKLSQDDKSSIQEIDVHCTTDGSAFRANYHIYAEHNNPAASFVFGRPMMLDINSLRAQEEALKSLLHCEQHHEHCPRPTHDPVLPARVIDCQDPAHPRLVSHDSTMRGKYLALSYVWGEPQPYSTNELNVKAYHERVDPAYLPQTIRDAISTTHAFGVRYLWVDSLCIIQDSPSDKLQQLPQMMRIYSEAYFTIIAASASKASEGFLQPRSPIENREPEPSFPIWCSSMRQLGTFSLGGISIHTAGDPTPHPVLSPDRDPAHSRGWCLQEWFLSPRALVYTSRTLQYHCQTRIQNVGSSRYESVRFRNPDGRSKFHQLLQTNLLPEDIFLDGLLAGPKAREYAAGVLRAWRDILTEYTGRGVTQPSDKLVAFAGVAERFHPLRKSTYYAGLWEDTLLLDLLWTTRPKLGLPVTEYQAPSWSWAAVNSKITIYNTPWPTNTARQARIQCNVVLADESMPFGQVTSGRLLLHSPIVRVTCRKVWDVEKRIDDWDDVGSREGSSDDLDSTWPAFRPTASDMPDPILCASGEDLGDEVSAKHGGIASQTYVRIGMARLIKSTTLA